MSNYLESKNVGKVDKLDEIERAPPELLQNPNTNLYEIIPCVKNWFMNIEKINAKTIYSSIGLGLIYKHYITCGNSSVFEKNYTILETMVDK